MGKGIHQLDLVVIGEVLKKKRREEHKILEDLADEKVSTSTLSNIERGLPIVNTDKIYYYAHKLGVDLDEYTKVLKQTSQKNERFDLILTSIQNSIDLGDAEEGLERLQSLEIPESSVYHVHKLYLLGRYYLIKKRLQKSQAYFSDTLRLVDRYPSLAKSNLKAVCYYDFSRVFYYKNQFQNALGYALQGINSFVPGGGKKHIIHSLRLGKAIYLEKLDRLDESLQTLDEMWVDYDAIKSIYVLLNIFDIKSNILKKQKRFKEAIGIALEGIEWARVNLVYERSFELWTTLGSIYLQLNELEEAENCVKTALSLKKKIGNEYLFVNSYTQLGLLNIKKEEWKEAYAALQEAVRLGEKTNDAQKYTNALIVLGDWYQLRQNYPEAVCTYQKANELAIKHGFTKQRQIALLELSKCWKRLDEGEFVRSLESLFEVELQLLQDRIL